MTERYAYLIETIDKHQGNWWQADSDSGGIEESGDSAETYALAVLDRYQEHFRAHLDDYEDNHQQRTAHPGQIPAAACR